MQVFPHVECISTAVSDRIGTEKVLTFNVKPAAVLVGVLEGGPTVSHTEVIAVRDAAIRDCLKGLNDVLDINIKVQYHEAANQQGCVCDVSRVSPCTKYHRPTIFVGSAVPQRITEPVNGSEPWRIEVLVVIYPRI